LFGAETIVETEIIFGKGLKK